ncbi:MAG TPA: hypothetical protein VM283_09695 [Armatimonadota bacterium]|nr:hypothetical protein [Armatimonadota bacterium]
MGDTGDRMFWRATAGSAFGLALGIVWAQWHLGWFLLCTAFVILGSLAVRILHPD